MGIQVISLSVTCNRNDYGMKWTCGTHLSMSPVTCYCHLSLDLSPVMHCHLSLPPLSCVTCHHSRYGCYLSLSPVTSLSLSCHITSLSHHLPHHHCPHHLLHITHLSHVTRHITCHLSLPCHLCHCHITCHCHVTFHCHITCHITCHISVTYHLSHHLSHHLPCHCHLSMSSPVKLVTCHLSLSPVTSCHSSVTVNLSPDSCHLSLSPVTCQCHLSLSTCHLWLITCCYPSLWRHLSNLSPVLSHFARMLHVVSMLSWCNSQECLLY